MSQVIMQLFLLGFILLVIYLIYCIIHTHMMTVENQEILMKLLSIEKQKQREKEMTAQPSSLTETGQIFESTDSTSDVTKEISAFENPENQNFWS